MCRRLWIGAALFCKEQVIEHSHSLSSLNLAVCAELQLNLKPQPFNRLRERFPPPSSFDFEARGTLSDEGFKLLNGLLQLNPAKRITAQEALDHRWCKFSPAIHHALMMSLQIAAC